MPKQRFENLINEMGQSGKPEYLFALIQTCWKNYPEYLEHIKANTLQNPTNELQVLCPFTAFLILQNLGNWSEDELKKGFEESNTIVYETIANLIEKINLWALEHLTSDGKSQKPYWLSERNVALYENLVNEILLNITAAQKEDNSDMLEFKKSIRPWIPNNRSAYLNHLVHQMPIVFYDRVCGHYVDFVSDSKQNLQRFLEVIKDDQLIPFNIEENFYSKYKVGIAEFVDCCWLLYEHLLEGNGILDLSKLLQIPNKDVIDKTLKLLSIDDKDINKSYAKMVKYLSKLPPPLVYQPFIKKPLFQLPNFFICPSPIVFLGHMSWILNELVSNCVDKKEKYEDKLGHCLASKLRKHIIDNNSSYNFIDLDKFLKDSDPKLKKADFMLENANYHFIVEIKKSLGLRSLTLNFSANQIIKTWQAIYKPLWQCSDTLKHDLIKSIISPSKKIYNLIVVDETILLESQLFLIFAKDSGLLQSLGISLENMGIVSTKMFEKLITFNKLEAFAIFTQQRAMKLAGQHYTGGDMRDFISSEHTFSIDHNLYS